MGYMQANVLHVIQAHGLLVQPTSKHPCSCWLPSFSTSRFAFCQTAMLSGSEWQQQHLTSICCRPQANHTAENARTNTPVLHIADSASECDTCKYLHAPASPSRVNFVQAALPEADIQGLKEAAQLTRHEAVDALRHAGGDAQQAFLNEVDAMHLNEAVVDALVHEYASFRCVAHLMAHLSPSSMYLCEIVRKMGCCGGVAAVCNEICMVCAGTGFLSRAD